MEQNERIDIYHIKEGIIKGEIDMSTLSVDELERLLGYETDRLLIGEGDFDLIRKCSDALASVSNLCLTGDNKTKSIVSANSKHLLITEKPAKRMKKHLTKRVLIAAAILSSLITVVTVGAANLDPTAVYREYDPLTKEELLEEFSSMLLTEPGTVVDKGNVTFFNPLEPTYYDSYQAYLDAGGEPLAFPTPYIDGTIPSRIKISCYVGVDLPYNYPDYEASIDTGTPYINIFVFYDYPLPECFPNGVAQGNPAYKLEVHNGIEFYLMEQFNNLYQVIEYSAFYQVGDNHYQFNTRDKETLMFLVENTRLPEDQ